MTPASIAINRFGLGARSTDTVPADPKRWLLGQLDRYQAAPPQLAQAAGVKDGLEAIVRYRDARAERDRNGAPQGQQTGRRRGRNRQPADEAAEMTPRTSDAMSDAMDGAEGTMPPGNGSRRARAAAEAAGEPGELAGVRDLYLAAGQARFAAAVASETPFVERLVQFWSNHFAVSADNPRTVPLVGAFEFEAIRPHVLGSFRDLLFAVETHPAMLIYLDQAQSIGPNSQVGQFVARRQNRKIGINENLAREIMELHTLGVRSVYSQADVTEFARVLTGWTVPALAPPRLARFATGTTPTQFLELLHEPGARTIIGRKYAQDGVRQSVAVLADLAAHPATARHIATKLARHFAGDDPPAPLVGRLETEFLRTSGDLPSLYRVLVDAPEAWVEQPVKFRTPWEWTIAASRAVGLEQLPGRLLAGTLKELGQTLWKPGSPAGYDDVAASWAAPDALIRRVEVAGRLARQMRGDPRQLAEVLFPGALSEATSTAIARAESGEQGTALLLASPEMMRR